MCSTDTKFWSRRRDSFSACSKIRCPLSPNLSLYDPKSTIILLAHRLDQIDRSTETLYFQTAAATSNRGELDVVRISAVAFQCNNYYRRGDPAIRLPEL